MLLFTLTEPNRKQEFLDALARQDRTPTGKPKRAIQGVLRFALFRDGRRPYHPDAIVPALELVAAFTEGVIAADLAAEHVHRKAEPPVPRETGTARRKDFLALRAYYLGDLSKYGIAIDLKRYERAVIGRLRRRGDPCPALSRTMLGVAGLERRFPGMADALVSTRARTATGADQLV